MTSKHFAHVLMGVAGLSSGLAWATSASAAPPVTMPVGEIRRGMIGVGHTVFSGSEIETFEVEVLGVMTNSSPRRDTILARLRGGPLAESGVIQGMSGSPVYIDGKLVGAVSSGYLYSSAPIAGITPIAEMLAISEQERNGPPGRYLSAPSALATALSGIELGNPKSPLASAEATGGAPASSLIPIVLGGFEPAVIERASGFFVSHGLAPMQGAGSAGGGGREQELGPGSPVAVELIRGDFNVAAYGTVTSRDGDEILAFGHPLFNVGSVSFPIATAEVLTVLPSIYSSFKISSLGRTVGSLRQDRASGVFGKLGTDAAMIPVRVGVKRGDAKMANFAFEIATHRLLSPVLMEMTLLNSLVSTEKQVGASTVAVRGRVAVEGYPEVLLDHFFTGDQASSSASSLIAAVVQVLLDNPFAPVRIQGIDVVVDYVEDNRWAMMERVWTPRLKVRAGESIEVRAFLTRARGDAVMVPFRLEVPRATAPGEAELLVGDAGSLAQLEARSERYQPRTLAQLIELINRLRKSSSIYALLSRPDAGLALNGFRHTRLPPSAYQLMLSGAGADGLLPVRRSTLVEIDAPSEFQIVGSRGLKLQVESVTP